MNKHTLGLTYLSSKTTFFCTQFSQVSSGMVQCEMRLPK